MVGELTQAFRRMDQRYGGSGLGLNIVIRIAQLHQGRLTLKTAAMRARPERPVLVAGKALNNKGPVLLSPLSPNYFW